MGGLFGVLYDCFRLFRLAFPSGKRFIFWQDGLFFLLMAILLFRFTLRLCDGRLRLFVLIGSLLGFSLYYGTVGALAYRFFSWLIALLRGVCRRAADRFQAVFKRLFGHITLKRKEKMRQSDQISS